MRTFDFEHEYTKRAARLNTHVKHEQAPEGIMYVRVYASDTDMPVMQIECDVKTKKAYITAVSMTPLSNEDSNLCEALAFHKTCTEALQYATWLMKFRKMG